MQFKEAVLADIPQMMEIRISVTENVLSNPERVPHTAYVDYLTQRGKGWVAATGGRLTGFAIADLVGHNIWALFVHPDFAGQGIGRKLHGLMLDWYFSQTSEPVWLGTAPGTRAEGFYRKAGWREVGMMDEGREVKFEIGAGEWKLIQSASQAACFQNLFSSALRSVSKQYYGTANLWGTGIKHGERAFCYELYHELRNSMDLHRRSGYTTFQNVVLQGELKKYMVTHVDMAAEFYGIRPLDAEYFPDLLLHGPGNTENQLAIVEVKCNPSLSFAAVLSDIKKINQFITRYRYELGIFLAVNVSVSAIEALMLKPNNRLRLKRAVAFPEKTVIICKENWLSKPREWRVSEILSV